MKKRTIGIIVGVVVIVVLVVVASLLLLPESQDDETETESTTISDETAAEVIFTEEETDHVVTIDVTNEYGEFVVVRATEADDENGATYTIEGWENLPFTSTLWTLPNNTASISANSIVEEETDDLAKFGLDEETAVCATLKFDDGTEFSFRIGNVTADSTYTYFATAESDTVYTVKTSLVSNFRNNPIDFLDKTLLEEPDTDDYPIVNFLTIERADRDYIFELDYDWDSDDDEYSGGSVATHIMVSPAPAYLSPDRSTPVVTGIFGLTADEIVVPNPTAKDYADYGLDEPFGTVVMDCDDGNRYTISFSETVTFTDEETATTSESVYVACDWVDMIYRFDIDNFTWATVEPTDVTSTLVLATYVWNIGTLDVVTDEQEFHFIAEGEDDKDTVVTLNGATTDTERFRQFYAFLLKTTAETIDFTTEPEDDPLVEIYLDTQDGSFARTFTFYALDDFTCLIQVDGQSAYTCRRSFIDTLLNNMDIYYTDEEFATNWR